MVYTSTPVVTTPVSMHDLEKYLLQKGWFKTWVEKWPNGVVRYDFVNVQVAEPIELDMFPGEGGNVAKLQVLARKEGVLEKFQEVIAGMVESFEINCAEIGIIRKIQQSGS